MIKKIKIFEAFSGIGAQIESLTSVANNYGFLVESIGCIEWYIYAIIGYQEFHFKDRVQQYKDKKESLDLNNFIFSFDSKKGKKNCFTPKNINKKKLENIIPHIFSFVSNENNFTDICDCKQLPLDIDIFTYSFPCQDISTQGKQKGIHKTTKSGLLYEVKRILKNNKDRLPKVLLMENVSALTNKKFINSLNNWIKDLELMGYASDYKVLTSSDFGSAQHRKRIFMISWLDKNKKIKWLKKPSSKKKLTIGDLFKFNDFKDEKLEYLNSYEKTEFKKTKNGIYKSNLLNFGSFSSENILYSSKGLGPTLTAGGANSRIKIYFEDEKKIRYLSPTESAIYMGFKKEKILDLWNKNLISKHKFIFLFGNSIPIQTLSYVFRSIIKSFFI